MSSKKHVFRKANVSEIGNPRRRTKVKPDDRTNEVVAGWRWPRKACPEPWLRLLQAHEQQVLTAQFKTLQHEEPRTAAGSGKNFPWSAAPNNRYAKRNRAFRTT